MSIEDRIKFARLMEKMERNKEFCRKSGICKIVNENVKITSINQTKES